MSSRSPRFPTITVVDATAVGLTMIDSQDEVSRRLTLANSESQSGSAAIVIADS